MRGASAVPPAQCWFGRIGSFTRESPFSAASRSHFAGWSVRKQEEYAKSSRFGLPQRLHYVPTTRTSPPHPLPERPSGFAPAMDTAS